MSPDSVAGPTSRLLSPEGRMSRMRYIAYSGGLSFLLMLVTGILAALLGMILPELGMVVMALGYLAVLVLVVMLTIKRCHDFNVTGWLTLIIIIPIAALVFWIIPGTDGDNRFGPVPPANSTPVQIVAWIIIALTVLSVVASVLAPGVMLATMPASA